MDEDEISYLLGKVLGPNRRTFLGVFASDKTPTPEYIKAHSPCSYIANTDQIGLPGTHWVAIYHPTPQVLEFFDSFGSHPLDLGFHFHPYFHLLYNQRQIQRKDSSVCGQYCIFFIYFRALGRSLQDITTHLTSLNHFNSDSLVSSFTQKLKSRFHMK